MPTVSIFRITSFSAVKTSHLSLSIFQADAESFPYFAFVKDKSCLVYQKGLAVVVGQPHHGTSKNFPVRNF